MPKARPHPGKRTPREERLDVPDTIDAAAVTADTMSWLLQVDGRLYQTKPNRRNLRPWVAVVRVAGVGSERGKLIVAIGDSPEAATRAAEEQWQTIWDGLSNLH